MRDQLARHEGRHQRAHRGPLERARGADDGDEREHPLDAEPSGQRAERERRRGDALHALADARDHPPVVTIGRLADQEGQKNHRQELREPDEPEVERAARERVHLPADRDGLHVIRERREDSREPEERERSVAEDGRRAWR